MSALSHLGHEGVSLPTTLGTVLSGIKAVYGIRVLINYLVITACSYLIVIRPYLPRHRSEVQMLNTTYSLLHFKLCLPHHAALDLSWLHTSPSNEWFQVRQLSFKAQLHIKLLVMVPDLTGNCETISRL